MNYNDILKYFLSTSVFTAGLVFIAKLLVEKLMDSKVEKYKNSLLQDTETFRQGLTLEIEKYKNELNTSSIEHQIRYSKLYEERGQVIKSIYGLLVELEKALTNFTTFFQGPEWSTDTIKETAVRDSIEKLEIHLEATRIFFNEEICMKIESILKDSHQVIVSMNSAKILSKVNESNRSNNNLSKEDLLMPLNTWRKSEEKVQNEIKSARLNLAEEFRKLIGVS